MLIQRMARLLIKVQRTTNVVYMRVGLYLVALFSVSLLLMLQKSDGHNSL